MAIRWPWQKRVDSVAPIAPAPPMPWSGVHQDGHYVNNLTGFGTAAYDRILGGSGGLTFALSTLSHQESLGRWRGSDLGGRIVEAIPDEMMRAGWDLSVQPSPDDERADATQPGVLPELDDTGQRIAETIEGQLDELGACEALLLALYYERAFGGGAIVLNLDDGGQPWEPVNEGSLRRVVGMHAFCGGRDGEVIAWSYDTDPMSPRYGLPLIYQVRNQGVPLVSVPVPGAPAPFVAPRSTATTFYVHASRLLIFGGAASTRQARVEQHGWGDSVFTRVDDVLSQFSQTWSGVANLMSQVHIDVLKVSGLAVSMAGGDKSSKGNLLTNRAAAINRNKSIARMLFIDGDEEFQRLSASLAGVDAVLQQFVLRLSAAADMPATLLMGQSPAGMNATGASDVRFFYDRIAARQKRVLLPVLKRLYRLMLIAGDGPTDGVEPERWSVKFRPLYQMTALEEAQLRKTQSETDVAYINVGVISPEEVCASRFGGSTYATDTTVDLKGREEMAAEEPEPPEQSPPVAESEPASPMPSAEEMT